MVVCSFPSAPTIAAQITDNISGATPIAGETYTLICDISGAENLNPTITYKWIMDSGNGMQVVSNSSMLSFPSLKLRDAANYACMATITSSYLTADIVAMKNQEIRIQSK